MDLIYSDIENEFKHNLETIIDEEKSWDKCIAKYVYKFDNKIDELIKDAKNPELFIRLYSDDLKNINIYVETCLCRLLNKKYIPIWCKLYVIIKYPFFIPLLYYKRTKNEWISMRNDLLQELDYSYKPNSSEPLYIKTLNNLNTNLDDTLLSNLNYFQYMVNFTWNNGDTGLNEANLFAKINNESEDENFNILFINVANKLLNLKSIIVYNEIPRFKEKLLNIETINLFKSYKEILPTNTDIPWYITNNKGKKIDELSSDKIYVVLNYDNGFYSLCRFNDSNIYITKDYFNDMIEQRSCFYPDDETIKNYIRINFYNQLYFDKNPKTEFTNEYNILVRIIMDSYNDNDREKTIYNILKDKHLNEIINEKELPYFEIYLRYLLQSQIFTKQNIISYIVDYIYPSNIE